MNQIFKNKRLLSLYEAFFTSLVVGLAETYFVAFALHKGVSVIESGLLVSLPLLFAGVTPFIFHRLFHKFYNSTWVLIATMIKVISLAALAFVALFEVPGLFYVLLAIYSVYWFGHFSYQPSWNKWISELIPLQESQSYFSQRTRIVQIGIILGLVLGGIALHMEVFKIPTTLIFIIIFLIAYHLNVVAFYLFYKLPRSESHYSLNLRKKLNLLIKKKDFFTVYSVFNCSLYLSAPYVSGYLLNVRGLDYISYMYVMGAMFAGKIFTTYALEKFKPNMNPHKLFFFGGLLAAPLPALWPLCDGAFGMSMVHFFSGIGWAGWEVGLSLAIFKNIKAEDKIEAVSLYNSIGLPVQVLGTIIGALLLKYVYNNNYTMMFVVAGILRFIFILPMYTRKFGEDSIEPEYLVTKTIS